MGLTVFALSMIVVGYWGLHMGYGNKLMLPSAREQEEDRYIAENMSEVNLFLAPYTTDHDIVPPACPHCRKHGGYKMDSSGYEICLTCGRSHDPLNHWGDRPEPFKCNKCNEAEGWCDCDTYAPAYAILERA